jgi:hypothetical protein
LQNLLNSEHALFFLWYQQRHRALHLGARLPVAERAAIGLFIGLSVPSLSSLLVMPCPVRRQCRAWWLHNLLQLWRDSGKFSPMFCLTGCSYYLSFIGKFHMYVGVEFCLDIH